MMKTFLKPEFGQDGFATYIISALIALAALAYYRTSQDNVTKTYAIVSDKIRNPESWRYAGVFAAIMEDSELCSNSTVLTQLKTAAINTGTFDRFLYPQGQVLFGMKQIDLNVGGTMTTIEGGEGALVQMGISQVDVRQVGPVFTKTFPNTARRVWLRMFYRSKGGKVTAGEAATGKLDLVARAAEAKKFKKSIYNWVEYGAIGTQNYEVYVDHAEDFFVELDAAGVPTACYGEHSSRNFCLSIGGIYNINAAPGRARCTT